MEDRSVDYTSMDFLCPAGPIIRHSECMDVVDSRGVSSPLVGRFNLIVFQRRGALLVFPKDHQKHQVLRGQSCSANRSEGAARSLANHGENVMRLYTNHCCCCIFWGVGSTEGAALKSHVD